MDYTYTIFSNKKQMSQLTKNSFHLLGPIHNNTMSRRNIMTLTDYWEPHK